MDVIKKIILGSLLVFLTNACSSGSDSDGDINGTFNAADCNARQVPNQKLVSWKDGHISLEQVDDQFDQYMSEHEDEIERVEDNYQIETPSTPDVTAVLKLSARSFQADWGVRQIKASSLWDRNIYGQGVIVAVIDSGIDPRHPDINASLYNNPNEVLNGRDDDGNGLVDDIHGYDFTSNSGQLGDDSGHGTHVAGIIAANHSNGNVSGVAPQSQILVYRFLSGPDGSGTIFDAISAINYAAEAGARVINASWGGNQCSTLLKQTVDRLTQQDVLFVTASGNGGADFVGDDIDVQPDFPAAFDSQTLISVGASTLSGVTAGFSNFGLVSVDLVAPGDNILSLSPGFIERPTGDYIPRYRFDSGTSMSTPFVSGAAALLMSAFPQATALEVKEAILSSVAPGPFPVMTGGQLDVEQAYEALARSHSNVLQ